MLSESMPKFRPLLFSYRYSEKPFRGKHWYVSGFKQGRRIQQWCDSEKEARTRVKHYNDDIQAHGNQTSLSPTTRIQAIEAQEQLAKYGKSITDAVEFYLTHLDRLASSVLISELCPHVIAEFERRVEAGEIKDTHLKNMRETLKKFSAAFGDRPLKLVTGAEIKAWLAQLPLAIVTRNRHLRYLKNVVGLAQEWNLLEENPFGKTNGFHDPHAKARQVEILSLEQLTALLGAVEREFVPYVALNAFSGLRSQEIQRLDWSEVKLERNLIDLPFEKSKNHRRKLIEVPENLQAWLAPFADLSGPVTPYDPERVMQRAKKAAGIIHWPQNALRHSFCSYAVALRGFEWTADQADHSVKMLKEHYWEVVDKETAARYWAIRPSEQIPKVVIQEYEPEYTLRTRALTEVK
jgi:integrase